MAKVTRLAIHKGKDAELSIGGIDVRACRREIEGIDGGVTLQVFAAVGGETSELVRFDCFRERPHYHAPGENAEETAIDKDAVGNVRSWIEAQLTGNLAALLEQAGHAELKSDLDFAAIAKAAPRLTALLDALPEPSETSYFELDEPLEL